MLTELGDLYLTGNAILLIAIAVWAAVFFSVRELRRRITATRTRTVAAGFHSLIEQHHAALLGGQLPAAVALGRNAVKYAQAAKLAPAYRLNAHYVLGRALSRSGRHDEALTQFQSMRDLFASDGRLASPAYLALTDASASLVLRRLGRLDDALELARQAVRHESNGSSYPSSFHAAGPAYAQIALALAQTDNGMDGRAAARKALETFTDLHDQGELTEGEPVAYAYYVMAYASRPQGDDISEWAREAVDRFTALHARTPALYEQRLADALALTGPR